MHDKIASTPSLRDLRMQVVAIHLIFGLLRCVRFTHTPRNDDILYITLDSYPIRVINQNS